MIFGSVISLLCSFGFWWFKREFVGVATVVEGFLVVMGRVVEVFFTARYVGESFVDACRYLSYDRR